MSTSSLSFTLSLSSSSVHPVEKEGKFGPRLGKLVVERSMPSTSTSSDSAPSSSGEVSTSKIELDTPALFATTSRGVVPHISRDHYESLGEALKWTCVPFETFLEHSPPVPVLYASHSSSNASPPTAAQPLHGFLGFKPENTVVHVTARDPSDTREMPTNGNDALCVWTLRGVRRLSPKDHSSYTTSIRPDVVTALSDTPFTNPPYSQKRLTKSIERSSLWLASLLSGSTPSSPGSVTTKPPFAILAHLAGLTSIPARKAFASSLLEPLDTSPSTPGTSTYVSGMPGVANVPLPSTLKSLDDGVAGYTVDLAPLIQNLDIQAAKATPLAQGKEKTSRMEDVVPLLEASLGVLTEGKPRVVNGVQGPHDILRLIKEVGIDLFDAVWAQRCADVGVALDFVFPPPPPSSANSATIMVTDKKQLGRNIYDPKYAYDFSPLGDDSCVCNACRPVQPHTRLYHGVDTPSFSGEPGYPTELVGEGESGAKEEYGEPFSRAYVHHLLHTHEMSAHTLLVMHNLGVVERFFLGIRSSLAHGGEAEDQRSRFTEEIARFADVYDEAFTILHEARKEWKEVDMARGKGRMAREKEREDAARAHEVGVDP